MSAVDGFHVAPTHDGSPMTHKRTSYSWQGDYAITTIRYECDCGLTCDVVVREMDGGPEMVRRRQEREGE